MRYIALGFCMFAAACASSAPTTPSTLNEIAEGVAVSEARGGSALPLKGSLTGSEAVDGAQHTVRASGTAALLGRFDLVANIVVNDETLQGTGTTTWTAANGDQIVANTVGNALVDFPTVTIQENQTIIGGTGRFSNASGEVTVNRTLNLDTGATTGTFAGTLTVSH
jgi:hypothetical protein